MEDCQNNSSTPGQMALREVENMHGELEVFKKPSIVPTKKKRKKIILNEDTYVNEIGKIIQRDFYPSLEKLKAQYDYLEAVERNDISKMRELYTKYSGHKPQSRVPSPATFETPANIHGSQTNPEENTAPNAEKPAFTKNTGLSLDQFFSLHTSEDNESFTEILQDTEKKHRQKYSYLFNEEGKSEEDQKKLLALPSIEEQAMLPEKELNVGTWGYKNQNFIMYVPEGVELTEEKLREINEKRLQINYDNTRLNVNPFDEKQTITELAKAQTKITDGRIGVDGKEIVKETPKVAGYSFIKDPSPSPEVLASPLMTWGMIEGTPFRLDGGDTPLSRTPGPTFKMAEPPRREQIALQLAERAVEKDRDKRKKAMDAAKRLTTPSPRMHSPLDRLATMSPAARRLASSSLKLGISSPRKTPTILHGSGKTPKIPRRIVTPKVKTTKINTASGDTLTDDLLTIQVPKRMTASDFFN